MQPHFSAGRTWLMHTTMCLECAGGKRSDERRSLMPCFSQGFRLRNRPTRFAWRAGQNRTGGCRVCAALDAARAGPGGGSLSEMPFVLFKNETLDVVEALSIRSIITWANGGIQTTLNFNN